jgi:hypothetical protein
LHNRNIARFQGQIETALKNFRAGLELRIKELFAVLHIQSHLTGAGIRKHEGFSPRHLLFVLTNLAFLHIKTVHDLLHRPLQSLVQAQKDAFYRFKKAEQNLKIKAFIGNSENAVLIQVWTALIAYLLLFWAKLKRPVGWRLLELTRLVQIMLTERCSLWDILCARPKAPPPQLSLFDVRG